MAAKRGSVQVNLTEHHNADYISSCFKMIGSILLNLEQIFRLKKNGHSFRALYLPFSFYPFSGGNVN